MQVTKKTAPAKKPTPAKKPKAVKKTAPVKKSVTVKSIEFSLDWVFDTDATQEDLFEIAARDRITALLGGYNVTLIAYGQTGSGKTHSMFGPDEVLTDFQSVAPELYGLVPYGLRDRRAFALKAREKGVRFRDSERLPCCFFST